MKNAVLLGIMASGKTSAGKILAKKLSFCFFDSDQLAEKIEGMSIKEIFEKKGEAYFRRLKKKVLSGLSKEKNAVIAAGGGAIKDGANVRALKKNGVIVCLLSSPEAILKRTGKGRLRPLLNSGDRKEKVETLIRERFPLYAKHADILLDTSKLTPKSTAEAVLGLLSY